MARAATSCRLTFRQMTKPFASFHFSIAISNIISSHFNPLHTYSSMEIE
jgi:hypothetical protein